MFLQEWSLWVPFLLFCCLVFLFIVVHHHELRVLFIFLIYIISLITYKKKRVFILIDNYDHLFLFFLRNRYIYWSHKGKINNLIFLNISETPSPLLSLQIPPIWAINKELEGAPLTNIQTWFIKPSLSPYLYSHLLLLYPNKV